MNLIKKINFLVVIIFSISKFISAADEIEKFVKDGRSLFGIELYRVDLLDNPLIGNDKVFKERYQWVTFLNNEEFGFCFTDDSKSEKKKSELLNFILDIKVKHKFEELQKQCIEKGNSTKDIVISKIAMGSSDGSGTFNILVSFKQKDAKKLVDDSVQKYIKTTPVPHKYRKEAWIDVHFKYPTKNGNLDEYLIGELIDYVSNLIKNDLILPDSFNEIKTGKSGIKIQNKK